MGNRVTDQQTQNGLIEQFKLKGELPEMEVSPIVVPVVTVGALNSSFAVSSFEKWRSVLNAGLPLVDAGNLSFIANGFSNGVVRVFSKNNVVSISGQYDGGATCGVALPGGSVGNPATDGIYRATMINGNDNGTSILAIEVSLRTQLAFGVGIALGVRFNPLARVTTSINGSGGNTVIDIYFIVRTSWGVNALTFDTQSSSVNGTGGFGIYCTKMSDQIPPNVIFP